MKKEINSSEKLARSLLKCDYCGGKGYYELKNGNKEGCHTCQGNGTVHRELIDTIKKAILDYSRPLYEALNKIDKKCWSSFRKDEIEDLILSTLKLYKELKEE